MGSDICPVCAILDGHETPRTLVTIRGPESVGDEILTSVECERCGKFRISNFFATTVGRVNDERTALALSGLLAANEDLPEPRRKKPAFVLRPDNLEVLAAEAPIPTHSVAYFDLVLEHVASLCRYPGLSTGRCSFARLAGRTFLPVRAFREIVQMLARGQYLVVKNEEARTYEVSLSEAGWKRVHETTKASPRGDRAFVAMWFGPEMGEAYENGIRPVLGGAGYTPPFRVDDPEHESKGGTDEYLSKIDDRILAEIRRARFVVADVTGARPSVYFEAGFAEGLGVPLVWCCRADAAKDMAFDTRQNAHILWKDAADLAKQLQARIAARGWERPTEK